MSEKKRKQSKKSKNMLIARSPEAFPKLTLFPEGWDLEQPPMNTKQAEARKQKRDQYSFPKTTDAML